MASKHLNQKTVDSLRTTSLREDFWDSTFRVRGIVLGVRVSRDGAKTFVCRYRDQRGKRRRVSLGDARTMTLKEAHEKVRALSSEDLLSPPYPAPMKQTFPVIPAVIGRAIEEEKSSTTFRALADEYLRRHAVHKKDGGKIDSRIIRHDLLPALGDMEARQVRRRDVIAVLDHIALERGAQVMANRTRALVSKIFNFGIERELVSVSPCVGLPRKRRERPKERFLDDREISMLWTALDKESPRLSILFKLILLTGQRPGEVSRVRWSEFNEDVWTIPRERVKNGRAHCVPLSPQVRTLLEYLRESGSRVGIYEDGSDNDFVFRSAVRGGISSRTIHEALKRVNAASGLKHFTAHDLRRTCATGLRRIGVSRETVSRVLNHTNRSVTLTYDWYDELPEMRAALDSWGRNVDKLIATKPSGDEARCGDGNTPLPSQLYNNLQFNVEVLGAPRSL